MADPVTTIVFDIGNVLIHWDPRNLYRKIFADEAEMEWFLAHVCTGAWNVEQDRGRLFADAVAERIALYPDHADAIRAFDERWSEMVPGPIDGTVDLLHRLRAGGLPTYAITNFSREKFDLTLKRFDFLHGFEGIVVSADERMIKPDRDIFDLFCARYSRDPGACLFIDDSAANVATAAAVGFDAVHFRSPEQLAVELAARDLLPAA